jgi:hypothetical protein
MNKVRWVVVVPALPLAVVLTLGLTSCATQTEFQSIWQVPSFEGQPFSKVAVISVMRDERQSVAFESTVVSELEKQGVVAVPGFSFLKGDTALSRAEMEKRVNATGADAVLIFKVLALDKTASYVPPTAYIVPDGYGFGWWDDPYWGYFNPYPYGYWGFWYPAMQVVGSPGYWQISENYVVQTALYRTSDDRLVWTSVSNTYDPANEAKLASSVSDGVIKRLKKANLIL